MKQLFLYIHTPELKWKILSVNLGILIRFHVFLPFFFKKGNNFCDLLFASLDNVDLLKWGLHVLSKERISHLVLT